MLSRVLDTKLRFGGPDTKFFFIAFWKNYGAVTPKPRSLKQLAEDLGLPVQVVSKAVAQLVEMEALRVVTQPEGRGRPRCTYEMSKAIQSDLREIEERTLNHPGLVEHVLGGERIRAIWSGWKGDAPTALEPGTRSRDEKRVAPVRAGKLSLANRLLLMTLLSHADPFGVVRGLSSKELCLLTGMNDAALKQRLRRLTELGFIRRHIAGIASPIFAEKLKGVYLLNLNHLQLSPVCDVVSVVLHEKVADPEVDCKFVTAVRFDRDSFLKGKEYQAPRSVLCLFRRAPDHAFDQLELFICDCVSGFLSRHWVEADSAAWRKVRGVDSTVKEQVAAFFRLPMLDPKDKASLDHDEIFDFLQHQVFELADEVVQRFSQLSAIDFAGVSYILVPAHVSIGHRCIALLTQRASGQGLANHWITKGHGEPMVASVAREVDIPLNLREQSGLLTPARAAE
ncbi:hypothetical protein [Pseudomonas aeruginosa]|uniref:hypothetical protein n=1 Tax=Pseudomonas aeruginosa TaxID=287 RepID=UPI000FF1D6F4|nr:hypothetical protein [Pseudomonas aeruginosa]RWY20634.1 hypothetical protein EQH76_23880 [Pseudomonas aeruginosa]RWY21444.1 hypothetical protein EQH74_32365 [Pseudomonas aeruginosa]HBP5386021.1 hypothetical protein [Pseudomonas aeruginosa]HBP6613283.1 hypothetical protein [Pseudomonas aeruginosa]HCE5789491.1 hypothetical protein [Pseudomonas aeruginosa]